MARIRFNQGQQRQFIDYALQNLKLNLRLLSKKIKINYELLKKYHQQTCSIDEIVFIRLCNLVKINPSSLEVSRVEDNWGQVKGGKIGITRMTEKYKDNLRSWRARGGRNHNKKDSLRVNN